MMFDSCQVLEPLLDSDKVSALAKAHRKALPQYARIGLVADLQAGKLWRFLAFDLGDCLPLAVNSEQLSVPPHHS
ncbi:MAG: hypothetical protein WAN35_03555 [Terracidiphilus sp.]